MRSLVLNRMGEESLFRNALLNLCNSKGSELILGYGFIALDVIKDDEFIEAIKNGFSGVDGKIVLIGCYDINFIDYIIAGIYLNKQSINTSVYIYKERTVIESGIWRDFENKYRRYHKKIAIKRELINTRSTVSRCILGSSNLTAPTFTSNDDKYSQEVDIYMWNPFLVDRNNEKKIIEECCKGNKHCEEFIKKYEEITNLIEESKVAININYDFEIDQILDEIDNLERNNFSLLCSRDKDKKIIINFDEFGYLDYTIVDSLCSNIRKYDNEMGVYSIQILLKALYRIDEEIQSIDKSDYQGFINKICNESSNKDRKKYLELNKDYPKVIEVLKKVKKESKFKNKTVNDESIYNLLLKSLS